MLSSSKLKIRRAFDRSAERYDRYADLQLAVAKELAGEISKRGITGKTALDVGCGSGALSSELEGAGAFDTVIAIDLSEGMCRRARTKCACVVEADAENLPVKDDSVDLLVSTLAFQWMEDMDTVFGEAIRVIKPSGRLLAVTLGEGTFYEMNRTVSRVLADTGRAVNGALHRFLAEKELARMAVKAGFEVKTRVEKRVRKYRDLNHLLDVLRKIGANTNTGLAGLGLGRRGIMARIANEYNARFSENGGVYATYNLVFIDALVPGAVEDNKQ